MIVSCPNCSARFVVDAAALGAAGRQVRCGRCRETWFQGPAEPESIRIQQTVPEFIIRPRTPGAQLPALKPQRRPRNTRAVGWLMLLVLLIAALAIAWYNRAAIVEQIPALAGIVEAIDQQPLPPTAGFEFGKPSNTPDGSATLVTGTIQNKLDRERAVPRLRISAKDAANNVLASQTFTAKQARVPANGKVDYEVRIDNVPREASQLSVEFDASP